MDVSASSRPPTSARSYDEDVAGPDIHSLVGTMRRRAHVFLFIFFSIVGLSTIYLVLQSPVYTAQAKIVIEPRKTEVVNIGEVLSDLPADSAALDTEVEILQSRTLAAAVAAKLNLERDPEFNPALWRKSAFRAFIDRILTWGKPVRAVDPSMAGYDPMDEGMTSAVLRGLKINRVGSTYVLQLSYTASTPEKAALLTNTYVKQYLAQQMSDKLDATREANLLVNSRLDGLRKQVQDAEGAVQKYRAEHNLMTAGGSTLVEQDVQSVDQQLAQANQQVAALEASLDTTKAQLLGGDTGEASGAGQESGTVQNLRVQIANSTRQIADLRGAYGENFPDVQRAIQQKAALEGELRSQITRVITALTGQLDSAKRNRDALQTRVTSFRTALAAGSEPRAQLAALEQNADAAHQLYASFLARSKETRTTEGFERADARVVSYAPTPGSPSAPKVTLTLALAITLGLALGLSGVVIAEMLDHGLSTGEDIERHLDLSYLPSIPALSSTLGRFEFARQQPMDYVVAHPFSGFAESFRSLRASVMFAAAREAPRVITITSSLPGEGKTTASMCLAHVLGLGGLRVVVVDCDLRRKGVSRLLSVKSKVGLVEVLEGKAKLEHALLRDPDTGACFLPLAPAADTPKDIFGTDSMKQLLDDLRQIFDVVLIDTPPVLAMADAMILAPHSDVVVLLARWRKTPRKAVQAALRALNLVHAFVPGVALTRVDLRKQANHGYGDPSYYYKSVEKYYRA